jgi:hypothetical protein
MRYRQNIFFSKRESTLTITAIMAIGPQAIPEYKQVIFLQLGNMKYNFINSNWKIDNIASQSYMKIVYILLHLPTFS